MAGKKEDAPMQSLSREEQIARRKEIRAANAAAAGIADEAAEAAITPAAD